MSGLSGRATLVHNRIDLGETVTDRESYRRGDAIIAFLRKGNVGANG